MATEAYLGTARSRISVQRHVRLVDYDLHNGCNARTWLQFDVSGNPTIDPDNAFFITVLADPELRPKTILADFELHDLPPRSWVGFELIPLLRECPLLTKQDGKNWAGFIACLVDVINEDLFHPLARTLMELSPPVLRSELTKYAINAVTEPPENLVSRLRNFFNQIIGQVDLWSQTEWHDRRPTGCQPQDAGNPARENRRLLETVFPEHFARQNDPDLPVQLFEAHNQIQFYTWDQSECCLMAGATSATLRDRLLSEASPSDKTSCSAFLQDYKQTRLLGNLSPGDFLMFEEVRGPRTGNPADANVTHRQVVRLTKVEFSFDPAGPNRVPIVKIQWHVKDALRFPLCISSITSAPDCRRIDNVSVARGNVFMADHGQTVSPPENVGIVPQQESASTCCEDHQCGTCGCNGGKQLAWTLEYRPQLKQPELTFAEPVVDCLSAAESIQQTTHKSLPGLELIGLPTREPIEGGSGRHLLFDLDELENPQRILARLHLLSRQQADWLREAVGPHAAAFADDLEDALRVQGVQQVRKRWNLNDSVDPFGSDAAPDATSEKEDGFFRLRSNLETKLRQAVLWQARPHLLDSRPEDQHFVVEMDNQRHAQLRFGNNELGKSPVSGTMFLATYRVGNGPVGNVGAEKIRHAVYRGQPLAGIEKVRNPLPSHGGTDPESMEHARMHGPHAFRKKRRAIIAEDYRELVLRDFQDEIQQARATMQWSGSNIVIAVTVDPFDGIEDIDELLQRIRDRLYLYRRIGHCVQVQRPIYVPLDILLVVCVQSGYLRSHVQAELQELFSNRILPDGRMGFFHPDNLTFGESIYLSRIVAAAREVPGVQNVTVQKLQRYGLGDQGEKDAGVLTLGPMEIPLIMNDRNRPECGQICLDMRGAR